MRLLLVDAALEAVLRAAAPQAKGEVGRGRPGVLAAGVVGLDEVEALAPGAPEEVAQLRGVSVLNINELANALKPVVLPGEFMKVFILKEGKEYNQGVAYLDDGTMVVVDNARKMISKNIDVVVTSVLQTTAGKMIFGRYIEAVPPGQPQPAPAPQASAQAVAGAPGAIVAPREDPRRAR